jgi:putative exosortase-associated protein (TIGR04073 family)
MKTIFRVFILTTSLMHGTSHAESIGYLDQVSKKLTVASSNLTLGWLEIPKNILLTSTEQNVLMGVSAGLFKGVLHAAGRTLGGVFDLVTFPLPSESIVKPLHVYQNFQVETRYGPVPF